MGQNLAVFKDKIIDLKNQSLTFSLTLFVFCIIACDNRLWFAAFFIFIPSINPGFLLVNFLVDSVVIPVFNAGDDSDIWFFFLRRLIPLHGRFFFDAALSAYPWFYIGHFGQV